MLVPGSTRPMASWRQSAHAPGLPRYGKASVPHTLFSDVGLPFEEPDKACRPTALRVGDSYGHCDPVPAFRDSFNDLRLLRSSKPPDDGPRCDGSGPGIEPGAPR